MMASCIALLGALVLVGTVTGTHDVNLASICANKHVRITTKSQIQSLAKELQSDHTIDCPLITREAIEQMDVIVSSPYSACSLDHVNLIKNYFDKFTHSNLKMKLGLKSEIPKSLLNFAVVYGVKVNNICKSNMISLLPNVSDKLLKPEDFGYLDRYINGKGMLNDILGNQNDYENIMLPVLFHKNLAFTGRDDEEKIYIRSPGVKVFSTIQQICAARFNSIYEQLMLPTIYLSNLGLNYHGSLIEMEVKAMGKEELLHQWYRIVFLCETVKFVVPLEGKSLQIVNLYDRGDPAAKNVAFDNSIHLKLIKYEANLNDQQLDDKIVNTSEEDLIKFMDTFKKHRRHINQSRAGVLYRMATIIPKKIKSVGLEIAGPFFKKFGWKSKSGGVADQASAVILNYANQLEKVETGLVRRRRNAVDKWFHGIVIVGFIVFTAIVIAVGLFCSG